MKHLAQLSSVLLAGLVLACAAQTTVRTGPLPDKQGKAIRVGYPPPPAKIEYIPIQRNPVCRYQDGYYTSEGAAWVWKPGKWIVESESCYYAAPTTRYEKTPQGLVLVHRQGGYFETAAPHRACPAPRSCDSAELTEHRTTAEQEAEAHKPKTDPAETPKASP